MNSNEIVYERKMTGSFMKLRCDEVKPLDEKILLKNNIPGFLKMEKCYVNNEGQYWYDISGVQSLEMRCQYNDIKLEFLEKLVVSDTVISIYCFLIYAICYMYRFSITVVKLCEHILHQMRECIANGPHLCRVCCKIYFLILIYPFYVY